MTSSSDESEVRELRDQLADARSLALQFQRELETAHAALVDARRELWRADARMKASMRRREVRRGL